MQKNEDVQFCNSLKALQRKHCENISYFLQKIYVKQSSIVDEILRHQNPFFYYNSNGFSKKNMLSVKFTGTN